MLCQNLSSLRLVMLNVELDDFLSARERILFYKLLELICKSLLVIFFFFIIHEMGDYNVLSLLFIFFLALMMLIAPVLICFLCEVFIWYLVLPPI